MESSPSCPLPSQVVDGRRGHARIISTFIQPYTLTFSKMGKLIVSLLHLTPYGVANPLDGYSDVPSDRLGPSSLHVMDSTNWTMT
jgi:hypothetical protein